MISLACQSDEVLGRYAAGDLPESEAEAVFDHLARCSSCLGRLDDLSRRPDSLISALRQPQTHIIGPPSHSPLRRGLGDGEFDRTLSLPQDREVPSPGAELNGYRVVQELGRGGMGRVYLAVHPRLNREVALKVLRPGLEPGQFLTRFEAERQALT